jgi:LysM repeat protein
MTKHIRFLSVLVIAVALVTTGCLRSANGETEPASGSQVIASNTPLPTLTPSVTPLAVQVNTAVPVVSPTVASVAQAQAAQPQTANTVGQNQQPSPTLDPLYAEATQFVVEATQTTVALTQTAEGPSQIQPTFTPTITQPQQVQPTAIPTNTPALGAPADGNTTLPTGTCVHEVRAGENLFRLSMRYNVPVADIARSSGISNIQLIVIGQMLSIPNCGNNGVTPPPTSIPRATSAPAGGNFSGTNATGGTAGTVGGRTHTVQQGETLFELSLRYGVPVSSIMSANPSITDMNFIKMSDQIIIPGA